MTRVIKSNDSSIRYRQAPARGVIFGMAQSIPFFAYSLCMLYGGYLVDTEGLEYQKVFR